MNGSRTIAAAVVIFVLIALCGFALSACGANHASTDTQDVNTGPARTVMQFPRGFRNVAVKCDGPNMVYSASRGGPGTNVAGSVAVVPNDPRCPRGPGG